jgi:hypothetical protein
MRAEIASMHAAAMEDTQVANEYIRVAKELVDTLVMKAFFSFQRSRYAEYAAEIEEACKDLHAMQQSINTAAPPRRAPMRLAHAPCITLG